MQLQPVPAFEDNLVWCLHDGSGRVLIVDPGDAAPVLAALGDAEPLGILLTHHHGDHVGGVAALRARWPGLTVVAPEEPRIEHATRRVADGEPVALGPWNFTAFAVPGHTRSHAAYAGAGLLFSGDTLFSLGCGRLFEGTPAQMHASLQRLAALPGATRLCCGHEYTLANAAFALAVEPGNSELQERWREAMAQRQAGVPTLPTTLATELACNPFLRCHVPAVRAAAERHAGRTLDDEVAVFAALRAWKDGFRA